MSNIWGLGQVKDTKFGMNESNGSYLMLYSSKVTVFTVFELFDKKQHGGGGGAVKFPPPPPPKLGLRNILQQCNDFFINLYLQVSQGKHCFVKYSQNMKNSEPLYSGHLVMAYRIVELCKFIVRFAFQNGFKLVFIQSEIMFEFYTQCKIVGCT